MKFNYIFNTIRCYSTRLRPFQIAIDGPAASGKSTLAKVVAKDLGYEYLDTGALYRAVTLKAIESNLIEEIDQNKIQTLLNGIKLELKIENAQHHVYTNGIRVTDLIRSNLINNNVSKIAQIPLVREYLIKIQQDIANGRNKSIKGVVMEGRDIGSKILPNADVKIYLEADVKSRAKRRFLESKEQNQSLELIEDSIRQRDQIDFNRTISPLIKCNDAIVLNSTNVSVEELKNKIIELVKNKTK